MKQMACVIAAAGSGTRMMKGIPKQVLKLHGKSILLHTVNAIKRIEEVGLIVIVTTSRLKDIIEAEIEQSLSEEYESTGHESVIEVVVHEGMNSRHASIKTGINYLGNRGFGTVLVHDAVRPFVPRKLVQKLIAAVGRTGAAGPWVPLTSTVIQISNEDNLERVLPRYANEDGHMHVSSEMPQIFHYAIIREAYALCNTFDMQNGTECLDIVSKYCHVNAAMVRGDPDHLWKITYPRDLILAEERLRDMPDDY